MAVSYVQDPSELARIVQQGLMGGMQLRQRRDAMQIQEAELEAQRQRELARQQMQQAQFGLDQEKFAADQQQRKIGNTMSQAYLSLADKKFGYDQQKNAADQEKSLKTVRALQARVIDNFTKAGQADPTLIGHIWDTGDIETLRGWEKKSSEAAQGKATVEGMRKSAQKMKPFIDNIVKPDGTPDVATQARLRFLADEVNNEDDYKRLLDNYEQVTKMQGEAQAEAAKRSALDQNIEAYRQSRLANGATPGQVEQEIAAERAGMTKPGDRTPPDVAEPLRKRVNDLDSQIKSLETALKGKIDPLTGEVDPSITGKRWHDARDDNAGVIEGMAAQLAALKQERAATYQTLNQATAKQPGVPGGQEAVTGQRPVTADVMQLKQTGLQLRAQFKAQNGREPSPQELADLLRQQTQAQPR